MRKIKTQNGCWNCKHVFVVTSWDDPTRYYCTDHKDKRPFCADNDEHKLILNLVKDHYNPTEKEDQILTDKYNEWHNWSDKYEMKTYQVCDNWTKI